MKKNNSKIKLLRVAHGWSQAEFAERVGTTQARISKIETGKIDPDFETLRSVARACGLRFVWGFEK